MSGTSSGGAAGTLGAAARRSARARTAVAAVQAAWAEITRAPCKEAAFLAWSRSEQVHPDVLYTHVLGRAGTAAGVTESLQRAAGHPAGGPAAAGRSGRRHRG
jgi:hypothetical protein